MNDWMLVCEEPYTRLDGSVTALWVWQRPCAHCGVRFRVKVPEALMVSGNFDKKHCEACRDSKKVARGKVWASVIAQKSADKKGTHTFHCLAERANFYCSAVPRVVHAIAEQGAKRVVPPGGRRRSRLPLVEHDAVDVAEAARFAVDRTERVKTCVQCFARSE